MRSSAPLRGVFFGTSAFAVPALRTFAAHLSCVLVVTQPDRPAGRGKRLQPTPVKVAAAELGVPTLEPERLRDVLDDLRAVAADLYAVASYGKIVPQAILDLPRHGALNVHPSLLPLYRGATPLQAQLRDGHGSSGVTIIAMDAGMDTGDVVSAANVTVGDRETYGELHDRLALLGAAMLGRACDDVAAGRLRRLPQSLFGSADEARRTLTRPLTKVDLAIDWSAPAIAVVNHIRALAPAPGARAAFDGAEPVKILAAHVGTPLDLAPAGDADASALERAAPGTLVHDAVRTGSGFVVLETVVPPGRGAVTGAEFARARATRPLHPMER